MNPSGFLAEFRTKPQSATLDRKEWSDFQDRCLKPLGHPSKAMTGAEAEYQSSARQATLLSCLKVALASVWTKIVTEGQGRPRGGQ
jgi:hypothetical protein